jgi:hypothetical protein
LWTKVRHPVSECSSRIQNIRGHPRRRRASPACPRLRCTPSATHAARSDADLSAHRWRRCECRTPRLNGRAKQRRQPQGCLHGKRGPAGSGLGLGLAWQGAHQSYEPMRRAAEVGSNASRMLTERLGSIRVTEQAKPFTLTHN